jgi:hypothetical protein
MTRAIERASVTETTRLLRSSTGAVMPKRPRRAKIFAVGRKAAGKNWHAKVVLATAVDWETREVPGIVEAKVWEIEVLAWVTVGVRGRELELAQAIVEGAVAVGVGVPSKAPVAEAVMRVAPAPAVPQAVAVVRVGEAPVPEVVVAPAAAVVAVVVVVAVAVGAGRGLS